MSAPGDWRSADRTVDARGLICPEPLLRARVALRDMETGGVLHVVASDPHADLDFIAYCERTAHVLEDHRQIGDEWWFRIRRGVS